jgi:hypothetical protein
MVSGVVAQTVSTLHTSREDRMKHLFIAVGVALFLMRAVVMAAEPVIKVECLCVAEEQGWVLGRSDALPSQIGIDKMMPGTAIVVLSADENRCGKHPRGCTDVSYKPLTGQVRIILKTHGYMAVDDDFRLNIEGSKATK